MVLPPRLSYIRIRDAEDIEFVELILNDVRYCIPRRGRGTFAQVFHEPLLFATEHLSLSVHPRKSRFGFSSETASDTLMISSGQVLSRLQGKKSQRKGGKVLLKLGVLSVTLGVLFETISTPRNQAILNTTTEEFIKENIRQCPCFRVLIIGKFGVGKSSLISRIFGVETAYLRSVQQGQGDIEEELSSPQNERFILHSYELCEGNNYDTVKAFIANRKRMSHIKDQLHAVWLCVQVPIAENDEPVFEEGPEVFLDDVKAVLGNIPIIVIFTKYDRLVGYMQRSHDGDSEAEAKLYLQRYCIQPIQDFMGGMNIPYVAVSSQPAHEQGHEELISLTYDKISESFTPQLSTLSPVLLAAAMAQRMVPSLKAKFSVHIGNQRCQRALDVCTGLRNVKFSDCLRDIHTDIVLVWNFCDTSGYLYSNEFREFMMKMAGDVNSRPASIMNTAYELVILMDSARLLYVVPLFATFALPIALLKLYMRLQYAARQFVAYIADLTSILEILFALTANMKGKKLTRTAIKLAFTVYSASERMQVVHRIIRDFGHRIRDRDVILEKIASFLSSDDMDANVSRVLGLAMDAVDLERDEGWHIDANSLQTS
ncbi:hypothetical protein BKA82DRAFT_999026 [Pisolithus tinctorius]|uniref:G domain-containing protein n=1 Tax=Pisolithus tinctorius Marx 270 TaxID=870435 RepID=A0A0C3JBD3_PISTI|nr:hypothetical protein BKA82DRAFT_999026 [Pisolithus tinctorius]KIO06373.1 hypothetical protein M404DRAFT_999026 [Pisolithus tinctorius Marx 270]